MRVSQRNLASRSVYSLVLILCFILTGSIFTPTSYGQSSAMQEALEFYKGKTIKVIVATTPGSGHDKYGRLYAAYLPKYLPGCISVVENVPGGGDLIGHNKLYESKPDGLTIGSVSRGMIFNQIIGVKGIRFDLSKFTWVANMAPEPRFFVTNSKGKFTSMESIREAKEFKVGAEGKGGTPYNDAVMLKEILGLPFKFVLGYPGTAEIQLAILKGEVDGYVGVLSTLRPMLDSGDLKPVLHMGGRKVSGIENIPTFKDLTPPGNQTLMKLLDVQYAVSRLVGAPPRLPEGRKELLRDVFKKMANDPEFLEYAKKIKLDVEFTPGAEVEVMMNAAMNQPQESVDFLKKILE